MRIWRSIVMFLAGLSLIGLVAVNLALASRASEGPDLGTVAEESGVKAGPEREARLYYMGQVLGRWSADGRCRGDEQEWLFARRRVIGGGLTCEIRRFVPGAPVDLDLHNCIAVDANASDGAEDDLRQISLERPDENTLTVRADEAFDLERCN